MIKLASAGCSSAAAITALVLAGPTAYVATTVIVGLGTTAYLAMVARRVMVKEFGPSRPGARELPGGPVRFTVKISAALSLALASDWGVLALAGFLGGPTLVTILKVAGSGRLFVSFISPVSAQLHPRLVSAAVVLDRRRIRRDVFRATSVLAILGVIAVAVATPLESTTLAWCTEQRTRHWDPSP